MRMLSATRGQNQSASRPTPSPQLQDALEKPPPPPRPYLSGDTVKQNEPLDPLHILRFRANAVMFDPNLVADLIEQFGRRWSRRCICINHFIASDLIVAKQTKVLVASMRQIVHRTFTGYTPFSVST